MISIETILEFIEECYDEECIYIGATTYIMPSGKCINYEPCSYCDGKGCEHCGNTGSEELYEDKVYLEMLEEKLKELGLKFEIVGGEIYIKR